MSIRVMSLGVVERVASDLHVCVAVLGAGSSTPGACSGRGARPTRKPRVSTQEIGITRHLEGGVAPRAHCVRTTATLGGPTPVPHPKMHPPKQPIEPLKRSVASTGPVFRVCFWLPISPRGFGVVIVLSGRPLDGCKYNREGSQIYPKFAPRAHRGKSALTPPSSPPARSHWAAAPPAAASSSARRGPCGRSRS